MDLTHFLIQTLLFFQLTFVFVFFCAAFSFLHVLSDITGLAYLLTRIDEFYAIHESYEATITGHR